MQMDAVGERWPEDVRRAELTNGSKEAQEERGSPARLPS